MSTPNVNDLLLQLDPTTFTQISGAQLAQMVATALPNTDRGFILVSTDSAGAPNVPNANATTNWQRYLWLRVSAAYVTCYVWNPGGATDATYLNWVTVSSASIGPGTIQGYQIANNTITSANISTISSSQITSGVVPGWLAQFGTNPNFWVNEGLITTNVFDSTSFTWGDLQGGGLVNGVGTPVIKPLAISQGKLALQSVAGNATAATGQIKDNSITTLQLLSNGNTASTSFLSGAVDPWVNITIPTTSIIGLPGVGSGTQTSAAGDVLALAYGRTGYKTVNRAILNLADPTVGGEQTYPQVLIVQPNTATYALVNAQGSNTNAPLGRVLQIQQTQITALTTSSGNIALTSTPTSAGTGVTAVKTAGSTTNFTFTPLSASSTLVIEYVLNVATTVATGYLYAGLYTAIIGTGSSAPVMFGATRIINGTLSPIIASGTMTPGSIAQITFYPAFGSSSNTGYVNSIDGSTSVFGGIASYIRITEYV